MTTHVCEACKQPVMSGYVWDVESLTLVEGDVVVRFTRDQAVLFDLLMKKAGRTALKHALIHAIFGAREPEDPDNVLKAQVCYMRKKLLRTKFRINTIWGMGYSVTQEAPT